MFFEVDEHHEVLVVLDEDTPSHWPVVVDATCLQLFGAVERVYADRLQPVGVCLLQILNLAVVAVQRPQNLDHFPLHLQLGLLCHQRSKRSSFEISPCLKFEG